MAVETDFHCIPDYLRKCGGVRGEGEPTRGGTCLILWPSGWAIVHGRALIKSKTLTQGNTVSGNLDFFWKISFFPSLVQNVCFLLGIRLFVWSIEKTSRTNLYNFGQTHVLRKRKLFQVVTCLRMFFFFAFQNQLQQLSQQKKSNLSLRVSDRKFIIIVAVIFRILVSRLFIHLFICYLFYPFFHSLINPFIHSYFIQSFFFLSFFHSLIYSFISSLTHSFVLQVIHSIIDL